MNNYLWQGDATKDLLVEFAKIAWKWQKTISFE